MDRGIGTKNRSANIIALDFDGVVCDGLNECLLTAWNTWHGLSTDAFDPSTLAEIPAEFVRRFSYCRNFVRHSGHFVMPFLFEFSTFKSAKDFEEMFAAVPTESVDRFLKRFEDYRADVIKMRYAEWLGMHKYYDGMVDVLSNEANEIFIVSGKDQHSIIEILLAEGVTIPEERIYGSQKNKVPTLEKIADQVDRSHVDIRFYDDNLPNVLDAKSKGFQALWAGWGYQTDNDIEMARYEDVRPIELSHFVAAFS